MQLEKRIRLRYKITMIFQESAFTFDLIKKTKLLTARHCFLLIEFHGKTLSVFVNIFIRYK